VTTLLSFVRLEGWRDSYIDMAKCGEAGELFSGDGNIVFRSFSDPRTHNFQNNKASTTNPAQLARDNVW
jgi:hypothetical protein